MIADVQVHLPIGRKSSRLRLNLKYFLIQNHFFKGLLHGGSSRVNPLFKLNSVVVGHFEAPVSRHSTDVLESYGDLAGVFSTSAGDFAEVPVKLNEVLGEVLLTLVNFVRVVVSLFVFSQFCEQFLIHFSELEPFPQVSDTHLTVSYVGDAYQGEVTAALDVNSRLDQRPKSVSTLIFRLLG